MINISNTFKTALNTYGKQIAVKITYDGVEYTKKDMISCGLHYDGTLLKSNMRCLDIETKINIPKGAILDKVEFGVRASIKDTYEYIDFGKFEVYESEYQVDTQSYKLTCYDSMLQSMIPYDLVVEYPITVLDYLKAICERLGWTLGNETFINNDKNIQEEKFDISYTFRDVMDNISQVGACSFGFKTDNKLYPIYPNDTNEVITEKSLKTLKVGEQHSINSVVLARVPQEDNIYKRDEESINSPIGKNKLDIENKEYNFEYTGDYHTKYPTLNTKQTLKAGTYTLSVDMKSINGGIFNKINLCEEFSSRKDIVIYKPISTNWEKYTVSFTLDTDITIDTLGLQCANSDTYWFKNFQIEEGSVATDYESFIPLGVHEIRIENNQIMDDSRDDYIDNIFNQLNGLSFYYYDLDSTGICYLEFMDRFTIKTKDGNEYPTIMLNDDIQITQGLTEKSFIEEIESTETDYNKATETDRLVNKTLLQVDKQNQTITALITTVNTTTEVVESMGESLDAVTKDITETITTKVQAEAGLIRQEISESYATKGELSNEINTITSTVESTASSVTTKFYQENIKTPLENVTEGLSEEITKREAIIRETIEDGQPVIELGASDSPVNTKYKNDGMYIYENGEVVAYFKNNKAYNTDLEVLNSFQLGNFAFMPRTNGNLSLVKVSEVGE